MTVARPAAVVVLAAGEGTRMRSATPKVLHALGGRSMLGHVVGAARALEPQHLVVVVGHAREQVTAHLGELDPQALAVVQERQDGTGSAVRVALDALQGLTGTVVVTPGDAPLLTADTLGALVAAHETAGAATTLLTAVLPDPTGYGRVVRERRRRRPRRRAQGRLPGRAARSTRSPPASTPSTPRTCATRSAGCPPTTRRASTTSPTSSGCTSPPA